MDAINKENYEAWFLDYLEGRLSANGLKALEQFLTQHPELKAELDEFESVTLPPADAPPADWSALKQPNMAALRTDAAAREQLYFRAVEGHLSPAEQDAMQVLLEEAAFAKEYALWQKTLLAPTTETMGHDRLYRFGLERPVSQFNFEYYLIALSEGLLNEAQRAELSLFAERHPELLPQLAMAGKLRLTPAKGIFYPDKAALYRKEDRRILPLWLYRAAAVVLLLGLAAVLWNTFSEQDSLKTPPVAEEKIKTPATLPAAADTTKVPDAKSGSEGAVEQPTPATLPEWEVREPDEVLIAREEQAPPGPKLPAPAKREGQKAPRPQETPVYSEPVHDAPVEVLASVPEEQLPSTPISPLPESPSAASAPDESVTVQAFQTLPELATTTLARKLELEEEERDRMALALARRVTDRVGEVLKTEVKVATPDTSVGLTYSVRIGSFKVSHSRHK